MAGRADRRRDVINTDQPGFDSHIHLILMTAVSDIMLQLCIDLHLWVIRAQMTLAACLRCPDLRQSEIVTRMAGSAATGRTIRVYTSNAVVRPCLCRGPAPVIDLDFRTMTLLTTRYVCGETLHHLTEIIVERTKYGSCLCMMRSQELCLLDSMASSAVVGRDYR